MSKFVVGQWVVCVDATDSPFRDGGIYRVTKAESDVVIVIDGNPQIWSTSRFEPFEWKVGRTYKTTLDDVTACIAGANDEHIVGSCSDRSGWRVWNIDGTGQFFGVPLESRHTPHLLPYEAEQPAAPESEPKQNGWNQIIGKWPGDETDEEIDECVKTVLNEPAKIDPTDALQAVGEMDMDDIWELAKNIDGKHADRLQDDEQCPFDPVNHPTHYTQGGVECIEAIKAAMSHDQFCGYLRGNALKYLWRCEHKGGVVDLRKAQWYLERLIAESK